MPAFGSSIVPFVPSWNGLVPLGASNEDVARAVKRQEGLSKASSAVSAAGAVVAAIPAAPWTQLAGAIIGLVAAGMKIGAKLSERGTKALAGDESAVKGFAKHAAKWSSAKRARVAVRLGKHLKPALARLARHPPRDKHRRIPLQKEIALLKLKLAVLYGLEANARHNKRKPLVKGEGDTIPAIVEQTPGSNLDHPGDMTAGDGFMGVPWVYVGGGVIAVSAILFVILSRRGSGPVGFAGGSYASRSAPRLSASRTL